jgi:hypothetical protein
MSLQVFIFLESSNYHALDATILCDHWRKQPATKVSVVSDVVTGVAATAAGRAPEMEIA